MDKTVICPGCGWTGTIETLVQRACPNCGYENNLEPYRLLTLSEMLDEKEYYDEVLMGLFLKSLFKFLGYPDDKSMWSDYEVVYYYDL